MPDSIIPVAGPIVVGEPIEIRPGRIIELARHTGSRTDAPVLFFCHGGGGNKDQWRAQWRALAAEGYSLVAWDLLGHGASDRPTAADAYAWDELVEDYLEVIRRYAGERNVLIGHSFGSGLTLSSLVRLRAQGQGSRVQAALLLGTLLTRPEFKKGLLSLPVWGLKLIRPWLAKDFRERAWHPKSNPALIAYEEKLTESNSLQVFKALTRQARWPTLTELSGLELPVFILAGDSDGLTPATSGQALAEHLPDARFELLGDCGHQLMLEQPGAVLKALRVLLATLEPK